MARKSSPNKRARGLMYFAPKVERGASFEIEGLSPEGSELFRARQALAALSLDRPKKFYFPDGNGGVREEAVPADFKFPFHDAMEKAFKHFKLHPKDPFAWRTLVEYFAYIFFWQGSGKRGGKTKWTAEREAQLLQAIQSLPGLSDIQAARKLVNDKKSPFYVKGVLPSEGVRGLRQRIGKVRKKLAAN